MNNFGMGPSTNEAPDPLAGRRPADMSEADYQRLRLDEAIQQAQGELNDAFHTAAIPTIDLTERDTDDDTPSIGSEQSEHEPDTPSDLTNQTDSDSAIRHSDFPEGRGRGRGRARGRGRGRGRGRRARGSTTNTRLTRSTRLTVNEVNMILDEDSASANEFI